jgi:isopenicillin N synthase-like dioxygenase
MEELSARLMRLFALGLDLPERLFDDKIDRHISHLQANLYPDQDVPPQPDQLRAGAHSDYGSLTVLRQENKPGGLQVKAADGTRWAKPIPRWSPPPEPARPGGHARRISAA